jgi:type II secretory ATPase GspE/PulE/Tfp pilus assembly ATPase PilB-like protein
MADLSIPLQWNPELGAVSSVGDAEAASRPDHAISTSFNLELTLQDELKFCWPVPPLACFARELPQEQPVACELVGLNGNRVVGQMTKFTPAEGMASVQVPPSRTSMQLRFEQFCCLTLTAPLRPQNSATDEGDADKRFERTVTPYKVTLKQGTLLEGQTLGFVEVDFGLFLFPPRIENGMHLTDVSVHRMFIPRAAFSHFEIGPRIGEVLVAQHAATVEQVEEAANKQMEMRQQKIGDLLLQRQVVTPQQLLEALERQSRMPPMRLGEALVSLGLVSDDQLNDALGQQKSDRDTPLGELLVRMGVVSRTDLQSALARKMGYPLVDVDSFPIELEALNRVPYATAARLQALPLMVREGRMVVALANPATLGAAADELEFSANAKVIPVLAKARSMGDSLWTAYQKVGTAPQERIDSSEGNTGFGGIDTDSLVETLEKEGLDAEGSEEKAIEQSDNSLVRLINSIIIDAAKQGVSDIHIESDPGREKIRVRFRKDGLMRTHLELPPSYRSAMAARIKIMCDLDISEKRKPQDGKINFGKFSAKHKLELRVATIPTNNGLEDVVMRILASAKPLPVEKLGLSDINLKWLLQAVERPYGMVLCVGPTGSGKTTTLHSALSHINKPERKIWTAEDPIEITQQGLRQVQVNPKIDWTFAKALRAFLRADPDVIMVGEIRDSETAHTAVEASLTGHLVMSTLHTNSAPETVTRLLDMGMDPFNFADSLLAVLAQRLVRRLCSECKESRPANEVEIEELLADYLHGFRDEATKPSREDTLARWVKNSGKDGRLMAHHSPGCKTCENTGFKGRAGLHEIMAVSRDLRLLIQNSARAEQLQMLAMNEGMRTLRQDGIDKVWAGVTTIEEVRATSNA